MLRAQEGGTYRVIVRLAHVGYSISNRETHSCCDRHAPVSSHAFYSTPFIDIDLSFSFCQVVKRKTVKAPLPTKLWCFPGLLAEAAGCRHTSELD